MRNLLMICFLAISMVASAQEFHLKEGDLLFQDLDCGDLCNAIEKVTQGYNNKNLSHVGIVIKENGELKVLEAMNGVAIVSLNTFFERVSDVNNKPKVAVGRIKESEISNSGLSIPNSIALAKGHLGKPYDDGFELNNGKFYCSELIYETFLDKDGNSLFSTFPMTYKDPTTNEIFPAWDNYFDELGLNIPEGELGLNPGGMSRESFIEIVHEYGQISEK